MSFVADLPSSLDPEVYSRRVDTAARLLDDGTASLEELTLPDELAEFDVDYDAFEADVEAKLDTISDDDDAAAGAGTVVEATADIDWGALFQEFGFHTVDANGNWAVPRTTLLEAIDVSEQGIQGDARAHVETAVERGILEPVHLNEDGGTTVLQGYRCLEVHA